MKEPPSTAGAPPPKAVPALDEITGPARERVAVGLGRWPGLRTAFPPAAFIAVLDADESPSRYQYYPEEAGRSVGQIEAEHGPEARSLYLQLVLLTLIEDFEARFAAKGLPDACRRLFAQDFERIVSQMGRGPRDYHRTTYDPFDKDLAICRLRLVPCGPELADPLSGVPRSVLFRGGADQLLRAGWLFLSRTKGFVRFHDLHLYRGGRKEFNEEGYDRLYQRIADLLRADPGSKGLISKAWWFDPAVEPLSPELAFLRQRPLKNGARIFRWSSDAKTVAAATKLSAVRRQRYQEGEYLPAEYLMVWPRYDLLHWAENAKSGHM